MIKDVFVLKKNSWHVKLMNFIWGWNHNDFTNMCPFFWLTILNTIIVIPYTLLVYPFKLLIRLSNKLSIKKSYLKLEKREEEVKRLLKLIVENRDLNAFGKYYKKYFNRWEIINALGSEDELYKIWGEYENIIDKKILEEYNQKMQRKVKRNLLIGKITKYTKWLFYIVGIGLAVLTYVYTILFIDFLVELNWSKYINDIYGVMIVFSIVVLFVIGIWALIKLISSLFEDYFDSIINSKTASRIGRFLIIITKPIVWLWIGLVLIKDIIVAIKSDNCPGIDWK